MRTRGQSGDRAGSLIGARLISRISLIVHDPPHRYHLAGPSMGRRPRRGAGCRQRRGARRYRRSGRKPWHWGSPPRSGPVPHGRGWRQLGSSTVRGRGPTLPPGAQVVRQRRLVRRWHPRECEGSSRGQRQEGSPRGQIPAVRLAVSRAGVVGRGGREPSTGAERWWVGRRSVGRRVWRPVSSVQAWRWRRRTSCLSPRPAHRSASRLLRAMTWTSKLSVIGWREPRRPPVVRPRALNVERSEFRGDLFERGLGCRASRCLPASRDRPG